MKYEIGTNEIKVYSKDEFNIENILECGQVFCYKKEGEIYKVFPGGEYATVEEFDDYFSIKTKNPRYFEHFFDLNNDYGAILDKLSKFDILKEPMKFGRGIRILNQDLFETMISFILSANNNIKRIKLILNNIRRSLGKQIEGDIYSFPTFEKLCSCDEEFFKKAGAGYRAAYLYNVLRQVSPEVLEGYRALPTDELREKLLKLYGVGPKVADCILLFGYKKGDVFPVDTWIHQVYNRYFPPLENRGQIRKNLISTFGELSGYAQQYLFFYQRSGK